MDRIETIKELEEMELKRLELISLQSEIENYYFEKGKIIIDLVTDNYKSKQTKFDFEFNNSIFKSYVKSELNETENRIERLIELLQKITK